MNDIKIKQNKKGSIKTIDKRLLNKQKIKENIIEIKDKKENDEENNSTNYAINKITSVMSSSPQNIYNFNKNGINNLKTTKSNIQKLKEYSIKLQSKRKIKKRAKNIEKIRNSTQKISTKSIKNTDKAMLLSQKTSKKMVRANKRTIQTTKIMAKKAMQGIKTAIKTTISTIKTIVSGTKAIIAGIIAGGWIAILIIVIICLIAMISSSVFGIFFAGEKNSSYMINNGIKEGITLEKVIADLNTEFIQKITKIQNENPYDEYEINSNRAEWKEILAVYSVKVTGGDNKKEVITLDDSKIKSLKEIFWDMNEISYDKEETTYEKNIADGSKNNVTKIKLHISVNGKKAIDMVDKYNFTLEQRQQLNELLKDEYSKMWTSVIYGNSVGNNDIVEVARKYLGNVGGQPFWSWYGFKSRVEWCACFVSFCANECRLH